MKLKGEELIAWRAYMAAGLNQSAPNCGIGDRGETYDKRALRLARLGPSLPLLDGVAEALEDRCARCTALRDEVEGKLRAEMERDDARKQREYWKREHDELRDKCDEARREATMYKHRLELSTNNHATAQDELKRQWREMVAECDSARKRAQLLWLDLTPEQRQTWRTAENGVPEWLETEPDCDMCDDEEDCAECLQDPLCDHGKVPENCEVCWNTGPRTFDDLGEGS